MIIFDANFEKIWNFLEYYQISFEFSLWHCYELFRNKNVVHSTLFRKIVIETQCIDCVKWSFLMPIWKNMKFSECLKFLWIFNHGTVMNLLRLKNVIHSTLFRKIVIETQCIDCHKWSFLMPIWQNMKFSEFLYDFLLNFHSRHSMNFWDQKCSPFDLFSKNCHRETVYRLS